MAGLLNLSFKDEVHDWLMSTPKECLEDLEQTVNFSFFVGGRGSRSHDLGMHM